MYLIAGLGNPGSRYIGTRHNVGFAVVEQLLPPGGKWKEKAGCLLAETHLEGRRVLLALPQKYMNVSGEALLPHLQFYKIEPENFLVIHDDLDLDPGEVRLKRGGGSAGQKGVNDIVRVLGRDDFYRIRIGIGHPRRAFPDHTFDDDAVSNWVLGKPGAEAEALREGVAKGILGVEIFLRDGFDVAQRVLHQRKSNSPES